MEGVFQWIKNITYYLIFVSLLSYLLPEGKYEQYIKLFSGAVFILLVINPLTGGLKLDNSLVRIYEQIRFTQEQEEFQQRIWGIEEQRMEQIMAQYEEAVTQDVRAMSEEAGYVCVSAKVKIEEKEEDENFGKVVEISLVMGAQEEKEYQEDVGCEDEKMVSIENVRIVVGEEKEKWQEEEKQNEEREAVNQFRRKVAKDYGLEEEAVKIIWQDD